MLLTDLLNRADDRTLQSLLGEAALKLLLLLDPALAYPTKLRELILELHSREELLSNSISRNLLLDFLKPAEITLLTKALGLPLKGDFYSALKAQQFRRNSFQEEQLFNFFELTVPKSIQNNNATDDCLLTKAQYSLFSHQRDATRKIKECLDETPRRVVLHMPTGSGKTRTAMNIIADHLRSHEPTIVIWLAYSEELCEQAVEEFEQAWSYLGNRELKTFKFWGSHQIDLDDVTDGFVVGSLSKVYNATKASLKFISSLGKKTSFIVIDEAHSAIAETYKLVLEALSIHRPTTRLLGLTATPGRTWSNISADQELADFFARKKVSLEIKGYSSPVDYLVTQKYLAHVNYKSLLYDSGIELSQSDLNQISSNLEIPEKILQRLAEDEKRNLKIILEVEYLAEQHSRIIVFSATVEHAHILATILHTRGYRAKAVTGKTPPIERSRTIEEFKSDSEGNQIICNFGVLTTGFDAPRTSAVLIARPTKSLVLYSQMVGRAIRGPHAGGNEEAQVVTIVDYTLPGFGSVAEAFNNWEDVWK